VIELQQSSEPLAAGDRPVEASDTIFRSREGDGIGEALMAPVVLVVGDIFVEGLSERSFAEEDESIQAFVLNAENPAFRECVQIRRSRRQRQALDAGRFKDVPEGRTILVVPVVENECNRPSIDTPETP
jgi:hypothetical protein